MASTTKKPIPPITDADIAALQAVLNDLKAGAKKAFDEKNPTTFHVYQRLVKVVSPEVIRANARKEREEMARINRDAQSLKGDPSPTS